VPLTHLKTGARAVVLSLDSASPHDRNKLMAMGVMPGATIHLLQRFPTYVVAVGYTQLALDKETARLIHVKAE
jgi:ferrous iron transport protein A